jgi:hypothetical protein
VVWRVDEAAFKDRLYAACTDDPDGDHHQHR